MYLNFIYEDIYAKNNYFFGATLCWPNANLLLFIVVCEFSNDQRHYINKQNFKNALIGSMLLINVKK